LIYQKGTQGAAEPEYEKINYDKKTKLDCEHEPLKGNSGIFKPRPYFWHEIRSSTHRQQFGESRRPSKDI